MGAISSAVAVGIYKGLAKLVVKSMGGGILEESIATELAGTAAKAKIEKSIGALAEQYIGALEEHPEFLAIPANDKEAVKIEVTDSLKVILDADFLADHGFDASRIATTIWRQHESKGRLRDFSEAGTALYRQIVDAMASVVLVVRENVKGWRTAEARRVQSRFDELSAALIAEARAREKINDTLGLIQRSIAELGQKEYRERREFLDLYLRAIRTTQDSMELFGLEIDPKTRAKEQRLSIAYISLNLKEDRPGAAKGTVAWPQLLRRLSPPAGQALLVRADAGMGKTTLLRWAAITAASPMNGNSTFETAMLEGLLEAGPWIGQPWVMTAPMSLVDPFTSVISGSVTKVLANYVRTPDFAVDVDSVRTLTVTAKGYVDKWHLTDSWRSKVPLLIILRDCKDGHFPMPGDFPVQLSPSIGRPPERFIEWLLEQGKGLVMIDGVDEVPPGGPREAINKAIDDLLKIYGDRGNLFIVTSRPMEEEPVWIKSHDFLTANIAPMTRIDRDALIRKWHTAYAAQISDEAERAECARKADALIDELNLRPAVARVATTPLLCAMLCAISSVLGHKLPGSESEIIERLTYALLWKRDDDRRVSGGDVWTDLGYTQRRDIAARLANYMVMENKTVVDSKSASKKLAQALAWAGRDRTKGEAEAEIVRERFSARGGIMRVTRTGDLEFVHNTFKEFLAASVFVSDMNIEFLADNAPREDCANVCRFAAACHSPAYTKQLIEGILRRKDRAVARKLIAVRMNAAASSLEPAVRAIIKTIERGMFPPKSDAACKALAELGNEVLDKLRYSPSLPPKSQVLCANTLARIGTAEARDAVRSYVPKATNLELVEQLCRALNPLSIPYVRERIAPTSEAGTDFLPDAITSQITDAAIVEWLRSGESVQQTRGLKLSGAHISDSTLREISRSDTRLGSLSYLDISATNITDLGIKELCRPRTGLAAIAVLELQATRISDAALEELSHKDTGLKALSSLSLDGTVITDAGLRHLCRTGTSLRRLTSVNMSETQITDEGLRALSGHESGIEVLLSLRVGASQITDIGVRELCRESTRLHALTSLTVNAPSLTDASLYEISRSDTGLKQLVHLAVSGKQVTDAGVRMLCRDETGIHGLTSLGLYETQITDAALRELNRNDSGLQNLISLSLVGGRITDEGLMELARGDGALASLQQLLIYYAEITSAGVADLQRARPNLEIVASVRS